MDKQQFGNFIAANRKGAGLTQRELAQRLHVTDKAVSKWERALSYPDVTLLEPLAAALDLGVAELMACRRQETEKEEQPVKNLLEISNHSLRAERRRGARRLAFLLAAILAALGAAYYANTYVREQRDSTIFLKEAADGADYLYVKEQGHLLRLKCGGGVDFDGIALTDEGGDPLEYRLDCRWNRRTYTGTVTACQTTGYTILGGLMDAEYEAEGVPFLFGEPLVFYTSENYYPDPYGEPRGMAFLCDFRFTRGVLDEKTGVWMEGEELLSIEDCMSATVADFDADGEQEVIARTRWPEKPYTVYKQVDGEIVSLWPDTVPEEIRESLRCIWEG